MTLAKQTVPVVLGLGVNQKIDPKLMSGSLLSLENASMTRTGEIRKRNGFESLGKGVLGGNDLASGLKLATYNNELLLIDRRNLYSYGAQATTWSNKGSCPTTSVATTNVVANSYEQLSPDMCFSRNTTTYAWEDSRGGVRAMVVDQTSGSRLIQDVQISTTGTRPRCFAVGQYHFVFYVESGSLLCRRVDVASPVAFGNANIISAAVKSATPHFDVCLVGTSRMVVAYRNASDQLEMAYVLLTGLVGGLSEGVPAPTAFPSIDPSTSIALVSGVRANQRDTMHVIWYSSTDGVQTVGVYSDFSVYKSLLTLDSNVSAAVRNVTGIAYTSDLTGQSRLDVFWDRSAAASINYFIERANLDVTTNTAPASSVFQRSAGLASKAYRSDQATRVLVSYASTEGLQDTYFSLSDASQLFAEGWGYNWGSNWGGYSTVGNRAIIQAKALSTVAGGHTSRTSCLPGVWVLDGSEVSIAGLRKTRIVADNVSVFTLKGLNQIRINHQAASVGVPAQLGQNLHIPGGFLKMYDGESVTEHGYHLYPESVTSTTGTAGSVGNGTYQHVVVWEWVDAKGQIHRSAPSLPVNTTLAGSDDEIVLTIPTLRYTAKTAPGRSEVIASVYRTTSGGTVFYKVSSDAAPLYNDPLSDTVSFNDTLADASIGSRPLLYTTGGTLENTPVSACDVVVAFKNRLFAAGLEQESDIRFSKEFVRDEGVAFSEALNVAANSGGGGVKALAVLDEKLVIFKQAQIFILTGDGPTDTGAQNDFLVPQQVSSDVGCTEPESVVVTPKGVMFKSEKGIYLLDRALALTYVGDRVQDFNSLDVSAAVLVPDVNQVRFSTREGTTLVHDYYWDAWYTHTRQELVSAAGWLGSFVTAKSDGTVLKEVEGSYSDNGVPIKTRIETSWVSTGGLQGYQRLYKLLLLGEYVGEHTLKATLSYDFEPFSRESFTVVPSAVVTGASYGSSSPYGNNEATYGAGSGLYQFELKPARQKCQSFKIVIEDLFPDSEGTGAFSLSSVVSVVGLKGTTNKLSSANTMTSG